jgi:hypothetical protein
MPTDQILPGVGLCVFPGSNLENRQLAMPTDQILLVVELCVFPGSMLENRQLAMGELADQQWQSLDPESTFQAKLISTHQ